MTCILRFFLVHLSRALSKAYKQGDETHLDDRDHRQQDENAVVDTRGHR